MTASLSGIKETLEQIEIKVMFKHVWFPDGKLVSYWAFFNRFNLETEKKDHAVNVKKFFSPLSSTYASLNRIKFTQLAKINYAES